jgi:hypothetical protein
MLELITLISAQFPPPDPAIPSVTPDPLFGIADFDNGDFSFPEPGTGNLWDPFLSSLEPSGLDEDVWFPLFPADSEVQVDSLPPFDSNNSNLDWLNINPVNNSSAAPLVSVPQLPTELHTDSSLCDEPGCGRRFRRSVDLRAHKIAAHDRPWMCPISSCKAHVAGFASERDRDRHYTSAHSGMMQCHLPPCPYQTHRKDYLKRHMTNAHRGDPRLSKLVTRDQSTKEPEMRSDALDTDTEQAPTTKEIGNNTKPRRLDRPLPPIIVDDPPRRFDKPLPPIIVDDPNDKTALKRTRNTLAALKSRERKAAVVDVALKEEIARLEEKLYLLKEAPLRHN